MDTFRFSIQQTQTRTSIWYSINNVRMLFITAIMEIVNMAIKVQIDGEVFLVKVVEKRFKSCFTI